MFDPADEPSFRLDVAGLSAPFEVLAFTGCEAISEPFAFEIDLLIDDPHLDLAGLLYRSAQLFFGPKGNRVHGQLHSLVQHEHGHGARLCRARLAPKLSCLDLRFSRRIFSGQSVPQILDQVLKEHGITGAQRRFDLHADYPPRSFCTQYRESDLQLVQRLCTQAQIHYHFEHAQDAHCLVFGDDPQRMPRVDVAAVDDEGNSGAPAVRRWQMREDVSQRWSKVKSAQGFSDQPTLRSGRWLSMSGDPFNGCPANWLLTRIEHRADQALEPPYSNLIRATDRWHGVSSAACSRLHMQGLQRAWVVTVDEPQPDCLRPVAVQFDWLYQGEGATPSHCWLPLAPALADTPPALLREGAEVVVSFLEGDPDQPIISGVLQPCALQSDLKEEESLSAPEKLATEGMAQWLAAAEPLLLLCLIPGGGSFSHCPQALCSCRLVAGLNPGDGR
ncbi:type VI secretion system Vgr family protein [Pseudomonas sp. TWP3-1]|uniref:type VI secretion system Vgr family protein n=1 Tax=Pseudomonas sp. TWP3-1 TaxID=2804631 RepID=UPI003CF89BD8